jgi:hypothetical protein
MENEDIALTPPSDKEIDSIKSFVEKPKDKEMKAEYPDTSDAVLQKALKGDPSDLYGQLVKYGIAKQQTQQELDKTRANREYQLAQNFANQEASLIKQAQSQMRPFNEFKPPKESMAQLGGMQAAMMLFAGLIGGKGAYGGIAALNAAGNMMNSYAQGQKEAFDKAKIEFDENMRVVEQQNAQVKEMLSQSLQLAKTNLTAAQAKLESDLKSKGYDLLAAAAKKGGITAVAQSWDQISKDLVAGKQVIDSLGGGKEKQVADYIVNNNVAPKTAEEMAAVQKYYPNYKAPAIFSSRGSVLYQQFENQMAISANEAAAQIKTLSDMPLTTGGIFGGTVTKSIFDAPIGALTNALTSADAQRYNSVIAATGYEAAKLAGGGRVVTDSQQKNFAQRFLIKEGDKPITVLQKLANMRQTFERAMEVQMKTASPDLKEIYANGIKEIQQAIPITTDMVAKAEREANEAKGKKSKKTFADFMQSNMPKDSSIQPAKTSTEQTNAPPKELLKEGIHTKFKNGQVWTLENGVPTQVNE